MFRNTAFKTFEIFEFGILIINIKLILEFYIYITETIINQGGVNKIDNSG